MVSTEKKIVNLYWPLVTSTTIVLYAMIIIIFPFSTKYATLLLFALIAYWSRIPGVGIASPFFILYHADFVDLFSLLISINVNPLLGAIFSVFGNVWSRVAGFTPPWGKTVIKDTVYQFIVCLMTPFLYNLCNHNILLTMMAYTILRRIGFIITWFIFHDISLTEFIILWTGTTSASAFVNFIYAKYFGDYLDGLLKTGVAFNWQLFIFATLLIFFVRFYVGKSTSQKNKEICTNKYEGWVRLKLYLFLDSINLIDLKKIFFSKKDEPDPFEIVNSEKKKKQFKNEFEFTEIRSPEEVLLDFFVMTNEEGILKGNFRRFKLHLTMFIISFAVLRCFMESHFPSIFEVISFGLLIFISINLMIFCVKNAVPKIIRLL